MATGDIVTGPDGKLSIKVGPWAKDKLHYINGYCYIFNMGMKYRWVVRTYIDLFAGPGKCIIEETGEEISGSPLVALSCKKPFTHYFFNDVNPKFIESLMSRVKSPDLTNVEYFHKDCNSVIDDLLQKLPANSLDFCFIDPLNWEIKFDSIRKLTEKRRMDLAITFHIGNIKRVAAKPPRELIDFFPDPSWQSEYIKAREMRKSTWRTLLDAYENGLRGLGYKEIKDYILEKNKNNVPLYHLIFASKHPRGSDFWVKVTKLSGTGQARMDF